MIDVNASKSGQLSVVTSMTNHQPFLTIQLEMMIIAACNILNIQLFLGAIF